MFCAVLESGVMACCCALGGFCEGVAIVGVLVRLVEVTWRDGSFSMLLLGRARVEFQFFKMVLNFTRDFSMPISKGTDTLTL